MLTPAVSQPPPSVTLPNPLAMLTAQCNKLPASPPLASTNHHSICPSLSSSSLTKAFHPWKKPGCSSPSDMSAAQAYNAPCALLSHQTSNTTSSVHRLTPLDHSTSTSPHAGIQTPTTLPPTPLGYDATACTNGFYGQAGNHVGSSHAQLVNGSTGCVPTAYSPR